MIDGLKVLALIPARGGSKGLPGKNIKNLNGKPVIQWTIEQAKACSYFDDIHVSTESQAIYDVATKHLPIHFMRPDSLAQDNSSSADVTLHVLEEFKNRWNKEFDIIVLLEPTSPLRGSNDLSKALELFTKNYKETDAVVSLGQIQLESPFFSKIIKDGYIESLITGEAFSTRQSLPKTYFPYGVFYGIKTSALREFKTFYPPKMMPYYIERWQNYEIDDQIDFSNIEKILSDRGNTL